MEPEQIYSSHLNEVKLEYIKIDKDWLGFHYMVSVGTVIFALVIECIMGLILVNSDILTTTVPRYIFKFIIFPSGLNFVCIAIGMIFMKSKKISFEVKIYAISTLQTIICLVLFTVHSAFTATYYIFSSAIILTTVYANCQVTFFTSVLSIVSLIISELFISWDVDKISIFESTLRMGNFLITLFVLFALSVVCIIVIRYEQKKNTASVQIEKERILLQESLKTDELTGIFNRKVLHEAIRDLRNCNPKEKQALAIIDIDKFKSINDNWGHPVGDRCLIEFAKILSENSGKGVPFRYGGDEFCILFYDTEIDEALHICEQIKDKIKDIDIGVEPRPKISASFGLARYSDGMNDAQLFINADRALYKAKILRNRIEVSK